MDTVDGKSGTDRALSFVCELVEGKHEGGCGPDDECGFLEVEEVAERLRVDLRLVPAMGSELLRI